MVNGLFTAAKGMMLQQEKVDITTNNLANANSTGFKKAMMATYAEVNVRRNDENKLHQDENQTANEQFFNFEQGSLIETNDKFDLAIEGKGFFSVRTDDGSVGYTRNGAFTRNSIGELVTLNGNQVLDKVGNPFIIESGEFKVATDGGVYVSENKVADLGMVQFANEKVLEPTGKSFWKIKDSFLGQVNPEKMKNAEVKQGILEGSNVSAIDSMVELIRFQRSYEADQKALQSCDETLQTAVTQIGRVH
jgi:flagellar basal-body rod protein FlgF